MSKEYYKYFGNRFFAILGEAELEAIAEASKGLSENIW